MRKVYINGVNTNIESINDFEFWAQLSGLIDGKVLGIQTVPTAGGTGYTANDTLTLSAGDGNAQATVLTVAGGTGAVETLAVAPVAAGAGYYTGPGKIVTGGTGNNDCTVAIEAQNGYTLYEHKRAALDELYPNFSVTLQPGKDGRKPVRNFHR